MTEALTEPAKNTHDDATAAAAVQAQRPKSRAVIADGFRNHTRGETLFNRITYLGVGYFGVTAVSVFLTWLLRDSKSMSPKFEQFTERLVKAAEKSPVKGLGNFIYSNMTILTLFLGGSLASVLPVKWLEDNKAKLVKSFDRRIYGKEVADNDPEIKAAHEAMEAMPKQTWGSVAASRILAFATTFGTSFLLGSEKTPVGRKFNTSIDDVSTRVGRKLDRALSKNNPAAQEAIDKAIEANFKATHADGTPVKQQTVMRDWSGNIERLDANGNLSKAEHVDWKIGTGADRIRSRVLSYITLDGLYTVVTSATLYIFTRVLAPILGKKQKAKEEAQAAQSPQEAVVHTEAQSPVVEEKASPAPHTHVSKPTHHQRLAEPVAQELTA